MKIKTIIILLFVVQCYGMRSMDPQVIQKAVRLELKRMELLDNIVNGDAINFADKDIEILNQSLYIACKHKKANLIPVIVDAGASIASDWAKLALIQATIAHDTDGLAFLFDAGMEQMSLGKSLYYASKHLEADLVKGILELKDQIDQKYIMKALKLLLTKKPSKLVDECLALFMAHHIVLANPRVEHLKKK